MEMAALDLPAESSLQQFGMPSCTTDAGVAEQDSVPWIAVPDGRRRNRQSAPVSSGASVVSGSRFAALLSEEAAHVEQDAEEEGEIADAGKCTMDRVAQHEDNHLANKMVQPRMLQKQRPRHNCGKVSRRRDNKATVGPVQSNFEMVDQDDGCSAEAILAQAAPSEAILVEMPRPSERATRCQPSDSATAAAVALAFASNILTLMAGDPAVDANHGRIKASGSCRWQQQASAVHRRRRDVRGGRQPVTATVRRRNGR